MWKRFDGPYRRRVATSLWRNTACTAYIGAPSAHIRAIKPERTASSRHTAIPIRARRYSNYYGARVFPRHVRAHAKLPVRRLSTPPSPPRHAFSLPFNWINFLSARAQSVSSFLGALPTRFGGSKYDPHMDIWYEGVQSMVYNRIHLAPDNCQRARDTPII